MVKGCERENEKKVWQCDKKWDCEIAHNEVLHNTLLIGLPFAINNKWKLSGRKQPASFLVYHLNVLWVSYWSWRGVGRAVRQIASHGVERESVWDLCGAGFLLYKHATWRRLCPKCWPFACHIWCKLVSQLVSQHEQSNKPNSTNHSPTTAEL